MFRRVPRAGGGYFIEADIDHLGIKKTYRVAVKTPRGIPRAKQRIKELFYADVEALTRKQ
ncbi:MAG: hypothetical protein AAGK66_02665 [Pseudomonadota bacterium]